MSVGHELVSGLPPHSHIQQTLLPKFSGGVLFGSSVQSGGGISLSAGHV